MADGLHGVLGVVVQSLVVGQTTLELAHVITLRQSMVDLIAMVDMVEHQVKRRRNDAMKIHVQVG